MKPESPSLLAARRADLYLRSLSALASHSLADREQITSAVLQLLAEMIGQRSSFIARQVPGQAECRVVAAYNAPGGCNIAPGMDLLLPAELTGRASGTPGRAGPEGGGPLAVLIEDVRAAAGPAAPPPPDLFPGARSSIAAPVMLSNGSCYGALCAVDPEPCQFVPPQVELLVVLARWLATQIERDREWAARRRMEADRHAFEQRVWRLFREIALSALLLDPTGRIRAVNAAAERLLGASDAELQQRSFLLLFHAPDRPAHERLFAELAAGQRESYQIEARLQPAGGRPVWTRLTVSRPRPAAGVPLEIVAICENIEDRKLTEEALRESASLYRSVFGALREGVIFRNAAGAIRASNATAAGMLGLTREQLMGGTSADAEWRAIHEDGRPFPGHAHPALVALRTGRPQRDVVMGIYRPDGSLIWVLINTQPLYDAETGEAYAVVTSLTDITQLKEAEEALRRSEERFAKAFHGNPAAVSINRLSDGCLLDVNEAWLRLLGYTREEVIGRSMHDMGIWGDPAQGSRIVARVRDEGGVRDLDLTMRAKSGALRQTIVSIEKLELNHEACALSTCFDITARKHAQAEMAEALRVQQAANEQLAQLNKAKSDFVSIVSHEFRTPLTVIQGFSDLLQSEDFTVDEVREYAADINREARRLSRMIGEMLDLDRMESGRMRLHREAVHLNTIVREVVALLVPKHTLHTIELQLDPHLPLVSGDRDRLTQVVTNLLSNAVKYSPHGGVITMGSEAMGSRVHVWVRDRGVGIPADALERIFERYARVESESSRSIQGTGLGLPIVRQIVDLHGGRVWAESRLGQGSTFHVVIPCTPPAAEGPAPGGPTRA